jgi:hypothetical protein
MLVLGLVAGGLFGSLVGPLQSPSVSGRALAAEVPLGLSPGDDDRARSGESGVSLVPVSARSNEARSSASGDVDASLAQAATERVLTAATPDAATTEAERDWNGRIHGVVVDDAGQPLSGATVTCDNTQGQTNVVARGTATSGVGRAWKGFDELDESLVGNARRELERRRNTRTAVTDAAGRFVLEGLQPGHHSLRAYADGLVFSAKSLFVGDSAHFVGRPVGEFHLDVRLPDGSTPEEAVVLLVDERRREAYRWTPAEPVLRLEERVAQLQVLAGNVRNLDWRNYTSDHSAPSRTLDLARDGAGPHVFELTERSKLRVTLVDESTLEPRLTAWVKVVSAKDAQAGVTAKTFESGQRLNREDGQLFSALDLTPGAYFIGAGRGDKAPEVTATVELGGGTTEAALRLGELDLARFLVVRCTGPDGAPQMGVEFSTNVTQSGGSRSGGVTSVERPGGEYWLPESELLKDKEWSADIKVLLISTARGYGKLETELTQNVRELALVFQPACDLVVVVTGDLSAGYSVGIAAAKKKGEEVNDPFMGRAGSKLVRVDGEGRATLTGLQPGSFKVSLAQTTESYFWGAPAAVTEVVLRPGSQTITMTAPTLYDVVVHAPDLAAGASFMLQPLTDDSSMRMMHNQVELGADQRARFKRIPAGEYTLMTWGATSGNMQITVPSGEVLFRAEKPNALRVANVEVGKLAAKAGLENGDLVLSVSGRPIDSTMSSQRIYLDVVGGTAVLQVLRGGTQLEVTLGPTTTEQSYTEMGAVFHPTTR